jgi:flavin-binding protein dodecin
MAHCILRQPQRRWVGKRPEAGAVRVADQRYNPEGEIKIKGEPQMTQKVIDVVGTSKESFAKAAENAVAEAAKTVRGMKWARVAELEMELDGKKIVKYRTTAKIYFDIEK